MPKRFHLAWFTNFTAGNWNATFSHGGSPWDGKFFVEFAQAMERACFDYMILEDTLMVSEAYGGTAETTLNQALQVPKHDPVPLAAMIAAATSRLGVVATMSTMAWPPFMLARVSTTIDHIAGGRFGWNIVTSGEDAAAQNFGLDELPPRELRYAMADEYMELVYRLFDSWEPDAVVMDRERGIYADHTQGPPDQFRGRVLQVPRPAQHRAIAAGAADLRAGRRLAARPRLCRQARRLDHRDSQSGRRHEAVPRRCARARGQVRPQSRRHQGAVPGLPDSRRDRARRRRPSTGAWSPPTASSRRRSPRSVRSPISISRNSILDEPLPRITTNGEQGSLDKFAQWGSGKTLRQLASERFDSGLNLIGTPDEVADRMGQAMEEIGGDGFLISTPFQRVSRRFINEVCEGLVPALQRRGLVREAYTQPTLRQTLREF